MAEVNPYAQFDDDQQLSSDLVAPENPYAQFDDYEPSTRISDDDEDPLWADYGRMIMAGGAQIGAGVGWLANNFEWGQALQEAGTSAAESWMEGLSDNAKHALSVEFTKRDDGELWTQRKWNKAKLIAAQSLLGTIAGMGTGAVLTKGLSVLGMRTAATTAAGVAAQVPSKAAGAIGFGLGEAAIAAPSVGAAIEAEIEGMDHETLMEQSPEYRAILDGFGSRGSDEDRRRQAKQLLADAAARKGSAMAFVSTFVLSAPLGVLMRKAVGGVPLATTRIRSIGVGGGAEAGQEFFQSGAEKIAENIAIQAADPSRGTFEGALEEGVGGALAGGMMGATVGVASPLEDPTALAPEDSPEAQLQTERDTLDVEVAAAQEQLDKDDLDLELEHAVQGMLDDIELEKQEAAVGRVDKVERVEQMLEMEQVRDAQLVRQKEAQMRGMEEQRQLQEAKIAGEAEPRRGAVLPTLRGPMHEAFKDAKDKERDEEIARLMQLENFPDEGTPPPSEPPAGGTPITPSPGPSERAEVVDEERAAMAREEAPETGSIEHRLQSEDTRIALKKMTDEIGMGERTGALIVKPRELTGEPGTKIYGTGEIGDEAERMDEGYTRLKSTNPKWFQQLGTIQGLKMSTKQVRAAVEKALAGKNLGKRQKLVIEHMIDHIEAENEGFYGKEAKEFSQKKADEETATQFEEGTRRKISEGLIAKANAIDEGATEAALESATDAQAIQRLKDIVASKTTEQLEEIANEAATSPENDIPLPTEAQKKAGNYKKGHLTIEGLPITIENPEGSVRFKNQKLKDHYGYIKRTEDADGDQIDVFVNPESEGDFSGSVFVVDQLTEDGKSFDEHKVMLGYNNRAEATAAYKRNYEKGWKVGPVTELSMEEFKTWIAGDTTGPIAGKETDLLGDETEAIERQNKVEKAKAAKPGKEVEITEGQEDNLFTRAEGQQDLVEQAKVEPEKKTPFEFIQNDLEGKSGAYRSSKAMTEDEVSDLEDDLLAAGWKSDPLGSEQGTVYDGPEGQTIVLEEQETEGDWRVHWYGSTKEQAKPKKATRKAPAEEVKEITDLDQVAETLTADIEKFGPNPPSTERNMMVGSLIQLKKGKHSRSDELAKKMEDTWTGEKPKGLTLGTEEKIKRQSVSQLAKEDKLTLQAYAIRLGLSEKGTKTELAQRIKDAVASEWPQPNKNGVYDNKDAETIKLKSDLSKRPPGSVTVYVLQIAEDEWLAAANMDFRTGSMTGAFSPLSRIKGVKYGTREEALRAALERVISPLESVAQNQVSPANDRQRYAAVILLASVKGELEKLPTKPRIQLSRTEAGEDITNAPNKRWVDKLLGPESESQRNKIEKKIKEIKTDRAKGRSGRTVKPSLARFISIINWINKIVPGANITAMESYKSLDPELQKIIEDGNMTDSPGMTIDGDVFIFHDPTVNEGLLIQTALHEITHRGLAKLFGEDLNPLLIDLYNNVPEKYKKKMEKIIEAYGLDITTEQGQLDAAEELIAILAQTDPKAPFLKKFIVKIRQLLIKMGINIEWTDADIHSMIGEAQDKLGRQRVKTAKDVALIEDIEIAETGEIFTVETKASEILAQHDKRAAMIAKIQNCL